MRKRRTFVSRMLALLLAAAMIVTGAPVTTLAAVQEETGFLNDLILDEDEGMYDEDEEATLSNASSSDADRASASDADEATLSDADEALSEEAREFIRRVNALDREKILRLVGEYIEAVRYQSAVGDDENASDEEWESACALVLEKEEAFGREWEPVLSIESELYDPLSETEKEADAVQSAWTAYTELTTEVNDRLYRLSSNDAVPSSLTVNIANDYSSFNQKILPIGIQLKNTNSYADWYGGSTIADALNNSKKYNFREMGADLGGTTSAVTLRKSYGGISASYGWFFRRASKRNVYLAPVTNASLSVYTGSSGTSTSASVAYTTSTNNITFHVNFSGDAKTYMSSYSSDIKNTANLYLYQGFTRKGSTSVTYTAGSADDQTFRFDVAGLPPDTYTVKAQINNVNGGDSLSSSTNTTLTIYKATYSGPTTQTDEPNGGVITNRTVTLPTPPTGSSYGTPTFSAPVTAASVSGTTLTYSTTAVDSTMAPTITIPVTGTNYNNYNYTVTINPQITPVTISGVAAESDLVYDGTEKIGYTGTAVGTLPGGTAYTGDIDTVWYQKGTGNAWTELSGKPQDAGDYKVTFSVPASAAPYMGSLDVPFTIAPKELTVTNTEIATREYDGTTNASFLNTPAPDGVVGSDDVILGGGTPAFKTNGNAGTNKEVELTTDFMITGADVGNYTLTQPTGLKGTITKKSITVAPGTYKVSKPYDGTTAPGTAVEGGALSVTGILTADSAVKVEPGEIPAYTNANVGTYTLALPISISGDDTYHNYRIANAGSIVNVPAEIRQTAGQVTNIEDLSKTYDGQPVNAPTFTKKGTGTATIEYRKQTEPDSAYTTTEPKDAGDYTVKVSVAADNNYAAASATADFTISKKEVTINGTTVAATRVYDATTVAEITNDGTLSANYDGSNLTIKRGTASYDNKKVGDNKPVTFAGFELDGSAKNNYTLTAQPENVSATITKKTITVSGTAIAGKVYDGTTAATLSGTRTLNGVESGDTVSLSDGTVEFANKNVGTGKTVNVTGAFTLTGTDAGNYTLTQPSNLTGTITACPVTISGTTVTGTRVYNGLTSAYIDNAGTVSPNYDGANLTITTGSATYNDKTVGNNKTVTFTGFALGGSEAGNYTLSRQPESTKAAITAKALTVTNTEIAEKVYDGGVSATFSGTPQIVGKVDGDTVDLTNGTPTFADKNVGTDKPVTSTDFTIGGADAGNYKLTQPTGLKGTITKKPITVAAGTYKVSKPYDGTTAPGTASGALNVTGILTADSAVKVEPGTIPAYSDSVAKSDYRLDIPISITGDDTYHNYRIANAGSIVNVPAEIRQTAGQVTGIQELSKIYDGQPVNDPTFESPSSKKNQAEIVYKEQTEPDTAYSPDAPKDAGDYTVKVSVAADNNYAAASATANFTISQKEVTINGTTVAATRVYNATTVAEITNNGTLSANYDGGNLTIKCGTASYDNKNVGDNKPVKFEGFELEGSAKDNYTLKEQPAATRANITKKTITVSGTAIAAKVYDGTTTATLSGTRTLNGVETGDTVSLSDGTVEFENKNVGTGKRVNVKADALFTLSGTDAGNYELTQPTGLTGTITACPVTISGTTVRATKEYDGNKNAYINNAGTVSPNYDGDNLTITTGSANYNDKTVGTEKTVTFTGFALGGSEAGNYTLSREPESTKAAITAKELTVTSTEIAERVYDGGVTATFSGTPEIVGKVEGDTVTLTNGTPTFADKNVGTDKPVTSTDFTIGGADAGNYTLTQPTGLKGTITSKPVTVAAGTYKVSKFYDRTTAAGTASGELSVTGILDADKPAVSVTTGDIPAYSDSVAKSDYRLDIPISITGDDTYHNYRIANAGSIVNVPAEIRQTAGQVTNIQNLSKTYDGQSVSNPTFDSPSSKKNQATFAYKKSDEGDNAYSSDAPKDAGSYTVKVTVPADDNYAEASATANFTISKKEVTINGTTVAATRVYDATTVAEITNDGTLSANYDGSNLTIKRGTASYADKNVGDDKPVTFAGFELDGSAKDNYTLTAQPTATRANITKKTITVSGTAIAGKVYDGTTTATLSGTRTLNGVETGDTVSLSDGTVEFADKNVGTGKTVNVTGDFTLTGTDAGNYTLTQPSNLTGTITACPVTISGTTVSATRVYNGLTSAYINNAGTVSPNYDGDNLTITTGSANYNDKTVGNNKNVTFTGFALGGSEASNYTLTAQPAATTAAITAKELTVTSTEIAEKVYDGDVTASFSGTPEIVGKVEGDTVDLTNGTPTFADKNVGTNKPVTSTNFTIGGTDAGNYTLTQPTGLTGTITSKPVTVAAGTYKVSKFYDRTTAAGTASGELSVTGILDADKPAVSVMTGDIPAYSDSVAKSDYRLDIPISITGDDTYHNYRIANVGSIVNVPAEIIQTTGEVTNIQNLSRTYNGQPVNDPTFESPSSKKNQAEIVYKEQTEPDTAYSPDAPKDAGSYTVKVTVPADDNYAEASATANFTISQKEVTISGTTVASTRVYDATKVAAITDDGTLSANYDGSDLTIKRGTASYDNKNVGDDKTVSFAGFELGGSAKDNYTLTGQPAPTRAKITKKTITVSGTAIAAKVYDGTTTATLSGTRTLNGVETDDDVSLSDGTVEFADKNVGTGKRVNVKADAQFTLTGTDADNYTLTQPSNLTGTITKKPATITGTMVETTRVYNGKDIARITFEGSIPEKVAGDDLTIVVGDAKYNDKTVGTGKTVAFRGFTFGGTDKDNYELSAQPTSVTAEITEKELTVSLAVADKYYDGTTAASYKRTPELDVVDGDTVDLTNGTPTFEDAAVGENKTINFTEFLISGVDATNYTLTQPTGITATIRPYMAVKGTDYTTNAPADGRWQNTDFIVSGKNGCKVSTTNTVGGTWSDTLTESTEMANGSITFYVKKPDGVISEAVTESYKLDKTAPVGTVALDGDSWSSFNAAPTFGSHLFNRGNSPKTLNVSANGGLSGIRETSWLKVSAAAAPPTPLTEAQLNARAGWMGFAGASGGTIQTTASTDGEYALYYIRMTDNAGNTSYISTAGFTIDTVAPTIAGAGNGKTYYTTRQLTVTEKNLASVKVNNTAISAPYTLTGDTNATYNVVAADEVGNTATLTVTMKPIASLSERISAVTAGNVKSTDRDAVRAVQDDIARVRTDTAGATEAELAKLAAAADNTVNLLNKIAETEAKLSRAEQTLKKYSIEQVKSSDEAALSDIYRVITSLTGGDNLTGPQRRSMEDLESRAAAMLARIREVREKREALLSERTGVNSYSTSVVNGAHRDEIRDLAAVAEELLATSNLTRAERKSVKAGLERAEKLLADIRAVVETTLPRAIRSMGATEDTTEADVTAVIEQVFAGTGIRVEIGEYERKRAKILGVSAMLETTLTLHYGESPETGETVVRAYLKWKNSGKNDPIEPDGGWHTSEKAGVDSTSRITADKGRVDSKLGIVTTDDSYTVHSRWEATELTGDGKTDTRWRLRYANGTYAAGSMEPDENGVMRENLAWELVNGNWWAFGADSYVDTGWVYDRNYNGWFYIDEKRGAMLGWNLIDGKWYYFEPERGKNQGRRKENDFVDGYYLGSDGSWDGKEKKDND